ncbi:DUF6193 family natural product biosynthesis protein [Streptomyces sp. NPDC004667]|uniref:DUF6193 family natural product biosynthesis protein n=1 Tax=Streptomyces sp. NPDC004667 TaxID=3154285 RepID=UPI0033B11267
MPEDIAEALPHDDHLRGYAAHYPEVVGAGSLREALRAEAARAGYALDVGVPPTPLARRAAARISAGDRVAYVTMDVRRREFRVHCRPSADGDGPELLGGTGDLSAAVAALHSWERGAGAAELTARWPFLAAREASAPGVAGAVEGPGAVAARWERLRESAATFPSPGRHELVEAAFREPRLRVLSPGLSMQWLRFSRRATPPIRFVLPMAMPLGDGRRYRVRTSDGEMREVTGAAEAVAAVLAGLPDDVTAPPDGPLDRPPGP